MNINDTEKLVDLVRKTPGIYDYSLKQHSDRLFIDKAWDEIAKEMQTSAFVCKTKWGNLRIAYSRYLREGLITPQGKPRKQWYLADAMKFLENHVTHHTDRQKKPGTSTKIKRKNCFDLSALDADVEISSNSSNYQTSSTTSTSKQWQTKSATGTVADPLIKYVRLKADQRKFEDDADVMFFKSMLADYKNLTQRRKRYFRELMVTTLNKLQEEDENDQLHTCRCPRDSA